MQTEQEDLVVPANSLSFQQEALESRLPVLVDISTEWCAPCRAAEPALRDAARRHAGRLKVIRVDGSESPDVAARFGVRGFPTFLGFSRGKEVARRAGYGGPRSLEALIEALLSAHATR